MSENPSFHEPFLARAAEESSEGSGDNGLGAFLTLRLVDQFAVDKGKIHQDATTYQIKATGEFLDDIYPCTTDVTHLRELVRVADAALSENDRRLLFAPMLAFAYWLEQELRLEEARDVLTTALRLSDGRDGEEEVAAHLNLGRVQRVSGNFAAARSSYERCGQMAARLGDNHSVLLSRIGQAVVLQRVGNLPESEKALRDVLEQANTIGDTDVEARACHDLGGTLYFAGRLEQAIPFAFRAYELHSSPVRKLRALSDTGTMLKELGCYDAARQALYVVLSSHPPAEVRTNAVLELLELSAIVRDRVSFERWRQELTQQRSELSSEQLVDFELKLGAGFTHFARLTKAEEHLQYALRLAEEYGMGERIFHCEERLRELQERRATPADDAALPYTHQDDEPGVLNTIAQLDSLAADVLG
jgi:tetratricopeptide (TPR) repeat protein